MWPLKKIRCCCILTNIKEPDPGGQLFTNVPDPVSYYLSKIQRQQTFSRALPELRKPTLRPEYLICFCICRHVHGPTNGQPIRKQQARAKVTSTLIKNDQISFLTVLLETLPRNLSSFMIPFYYGSASSFGSGSAKTKSYGSGSATLFHRPAI